VTDRDKKKEAYNMAEIDVTFINAGDDAQLDADLDDSLTNEQVIQALTNEGFLSPLTDSNQYYMLTIKGRSTIAEGQTLIAAGARSGDQIRVNVAQRGGYCEGIAHE
jgi:hypothetical protein